MSDRAAPPHGEAEIRQWLIDKIADRVGVSPLSIDPSKPFAVLGVDSTEAVVISGELQEWLGRRVPPTIAWDHPTIDAAAHYLANRD
ncbi:MAG: acyl carrier protein [Deltaproteobacteria bacterium]|nr:acyl carrier protein [Deltaproteobacteria bacterium]